MNSFPVQEFESTTNNEILESLQKQGDKNISISNKDQNILESSNTYQDTQDDPYSTATITLTEEDIEKICKICQISWENFFSKPLPDYSTMEVYYDGEMRIFRELNRTAQLEIIKTAHVSTISTDDLNNQINTSDSEFENFVHRIVLFNKGSLLMCHGIAHSVRTAINSLLTGQIYIQNFREFSKISRKILMCSISASLLHDIGRCFGGDGSDIFGTTSSFIASEILTEVGGFSDDEIEWIKEAIEIGGIHQKDVKEFHSNSFKFLNERQIIACLMGDADSYEFERFGSCDVEYTSIKKLGIQTIDGNRPDEILNYIKKRACELVRKIREPSGCKNGKSGEGDMYTAFLRKELMKLNENCYDK